MCIGSYLVMFLPSSAHTTSDCSFQSGSNMHKTLFPMQIWLGPIQLLQTQVKKAGRHSYPIWPYSSGLSAQTDIQRSGSDWENVAGYHHQRLRALLCLYSLVFSQSPLLATYANERIAFSDLWKSVWADAGPSAWNPLLPPFIINSTLLGLSYIKICDSSLLEAFSRKSLCTCR